MPKDVVIKSNRYGLKLILNDELPFSELLKGIGAKFEEMSDFFKDAKMAIAFEERNLTTDEEKEIVEVIMQNSNIQIVSIIDNDMELEEKMRVSVEANEQTNQTDKKATAKAQFMQDKANAMIQEQVISSNAVENAEVQSGFYKGNLRSGQLLECETSITIIGDVNPGAKVISGGNIVILGSLKGNAHAGALGNEACFIYALDMKPIQLQIGDYIAKSPDKEKVRGRFKRKEKLATNDYSSQIAVVQDGFICIEPMTKKYLSNL